MISLNELSGCKLQEVIIARTFLLDEPTNNLDIKSQIEIINLTKKIVKKDGISAVITSYDLNLATYYADRIVMMKNGRIFAEGIKRLLAKRPLELCGIDVKIDLTGNV